MSDSVINFALGRLSNDAKVLLARQKNGVIQGNDRFDWEEFRKMEYYTGVGVRFQQADEDTLDVTQLFMLNPFGVAVSLRARDELLLELDASGGAREVPVPHSCVKEKTAADAQHPMPNHGNTPPTVSTTAHEPENCPFCGSAPYTDVESACKIGARTGHTYAVACSNCEATAPGDNNSFAGAMHNWNTRVTG